MKIPEIFVPEKDLTNRINKYLEEKPASLYDNVKRLYEGFDSKNMFLLYGPPGTGKTFASNKTKEALSKEYTLLNVHLSPIDAYAIVTKFEDYFDTKIAPALSANKKVYVDIIEIEKFTTHAQKALNNILIKYRNNKNIVFVFQSYNHEVFSREGQTIDIEFTKKQL